MAVMRPPKRRLDRKQIWESTRPFAVENRGNQPGKPALGRSAHRQAGLFFRGFLAVPAGNQTRQQHRASLYAGSASCTEYTLLIRRCNPRPSKLTSNRQDKVKRAGADVVDGTVTFVTNGAARSASGRSRGPKSSRCGNRRPSRKGFHRVAAGGEPQRPRRLRWRSHRRNRPSRTANAPRPASRKPQARS